MKDMTRRFETLREADVPKSRMSKHRDIIAAILKDLDRLKPGSALQVPLEELGDTKANVRSALNRATRKNNRKIATATDEKFLYIWNTD
jgi:lambda repressor-like predicted transcriptional regulator